MVTHLDLELGRRTFTLCPSTQFDIFTLSTYFYALIKNVEEAHTQITMGAKFFIFINYHLYSI